MAVRHVPGQSSSAERGPLFRFRCAGCSYGASCRAAPVRCPMCGSSTWEFDDWRPFSQIAVDLAPVRHHSEPFPPTG